MSTKLSDQEIKSRLIRLVNVERLYQEQKETIKIVREENKLLKERIVFLENENTELKTQLTDLKYQFEQMKVIVFGKKRKAFARDEDDEPRPPVLGRAAEQRRQHCRGGQPLESALQSARHSRRNRRRRAGRAAGHER